MIKLNKRKFTRTCSNLISNDHKGITLVALIITIIIMLILAGVTINIALNGGLFSTTKEAVRQTEIAAQKEKIDAERINIIAEQISKGLTSKEFMDRYEEELRKSKDFEGAVITRKDEGTIEIITKEGYKYEITEEGTNYMGSTEAPEAPEEPQTPTDLNKSNTSFEYNIKGWTNQKVKVKIKVTEQIEGTLQYLRDGGTWTEYKGEEIEISDNNTSISARVINSEGKSGTVWTGNIENIDRIAPTASLTPNGGTGYTMPSEGNAKISTKITAEDPEATSIDGHSGLETLEYAWSTSSTAEPAEGWTTFTNGETISKEDISTAGTWYLWTKVIDKAGNRAENIKTSNAFTIGGKETEANKITLVPNKTKWTNEDVTVEAKYGANLTKNRTLTCEGTEGTDYTISGQVVTVKTNDKIVTAMAEDNEGNKVVATITISNIDKTAPTISLNADTPSPAVVGNSVYLRFEDKEGEGSGASGIAKWGWRGTSYTETLWTNEMAPNTTLLENQKLTPTRAETYSIYAQDYAGNITEGDQIIEVEFLEAHLKNENTLKYYNTMQAAFDDANQSDTLTLLNTYTDNSTPSLTKTVSLNIGSNVLTKSKNGISIKSGGLLYLGGNGTIKTEEGIDLINVYSDGCFTFGLLSTNQFYPALAYEGELRSSTNDVNKYVIRCQNGGNVENETMSTGAKIIANTRGIINYGTVELNGPLTVSSTAGNTVYNAATRYNDLVRRCGN